ncbi:MAG TPA: hypothetical protein VHZ96_07480 [Frankiaceae bacterium]|jgi:hypothetical protein|nr:hypothetical protein [Frankiaceae bacterium]
MSQQDSDLDFHSKDAEGEAHGASATADESVTQGQADEINPDDEKAAEGLTVSEKDAAAYRESMERGAAQQGEGAPEV